jgi:hypothetical protein
LLPQAHFPANPFKVNLGNLVGQSLPLDLRQGLPVHQKMRLLASA